VSRQIGRPPARDRAAYFGAAYSLLGERGYDGLTIQALCGRVGVTKGAFYHQFRDLPTFVGSFATAWQAWLGDRLERYASEPDLRRRLEVVANGSYVIMTREMQAMRAWARVNPTIAEAMTGLHRGAAALTVGTVAELAQDEETGQVLATMGLTMWVGVQLRPRPLAYEHFMQLLGPMYRTTGVQSELFGAGERTHLKVLSLGRAQPALRPRTLPRNHSHAAERSATTAFRPCLGRRNDTRQRYFVAAGELLGKHGSGAVTIAALAQNLDVTKGSFHHHFGGYDAFINEMARAWATAELARIDQLMTESNVLRRTELLLSDLLVCPDSTDTAWRAWGHTNIIVREALRRVDRRRERAIAIALEQLLGISSADLLAEMTLGLALGLHDWYPPLDRAVKYRVAVEWLRRMVGIDAEIRTDSGAPVLVLSAA
jgi:AcrR family transcriptional regulator